ncbi:MAG: peptidase family protein [Anaerolineales bacterium]|nr:peptidase family protein [Anaerolineales bacterium]
MVGRNRRADDLSISELEALLAHKRVEARRVRLEQFRATGRTLRLEAPADLGPATAVDTIGGPVGEPSRRRVAVNRTLLLVEVGAVLGLVVILLSGLGALRELNAEVGAALEGPTPFFNCSQPSPCTTGADEVHRVGMKRLRACSGPGVGSPTTGSDSTNGRRLSGISDSLG